MLEIKGKVNTAVCYAKVIEDEAIEQIRRMPNGTIPRLTEPEGLCREKKQKKI